MTLYEYLFSEFKEGRLTPFYERMYPELLAYATRLLGEELAFYAEDCVQDAIFSTYRETRRFESPLQWRIFLYTCIRNEAISLLRKGQAQRNYLSSAKDYEEDPSLGFIEQETLTLLNEAIRALPAPYRTLFELSFEQGLKNVEIARQLQIAEITVKKRKSRLIELLRQSLQDKTDEKLICLLICLVG